MVSRQKIVFYLTYSLNNLRVNGRQTIFGILCISAGVAAIVSLQTLGVMIKDAFSGDLQESNLADIRVLPEPPASAPVEVAKRAQDERLVSAEGSFQLDAVRRIQSWIDTNYPGQIQLTYRQSIETNSGLSVTNIRTGKLNPLTIPYVVEVSKYPLYGQVTTEDGHSLRSLIQEPTDIVISRKLARALDAQVGDVLRLNDSSADFTVRGIMSDKVSGSIDELKVAAGVLGFYYLDVSAVDLFPLMHDRADMIFLRLKKPSDTERVNKAFLNEFPYFSTVTTNDLKEENSALSSTIFQLVNVMGLISMLIGGIGIVNTMSVMVRRRTEEIAILKTVGLAPQEVTILFLVEAILIGLAGSLFGIVSGWGLAYLLKNLAEVFLAQPLTFHVTLTPVLTGFIMGVIVTAVFGLLPTLAAGQVRPALVLHPRDLIIPASARLQLFVALVLMMLVLSGLARILIGSLPEIGIDFKPFSGTVGVALGFLIGVPTALQEMPHWVEVSHHTRLFRVTRWIVLLIGLPLAGYLVGRMLPTMLILFVVFTAVGVLYILLWLLIWLIGRLSAEWLQVDFKMALRSIFVRRGRNASTLVALVVGIFILSLMTMLVSALRQRFVEQLVQETGGNVIIYVPRSNKTLTEVENRLNSLYGPDSYAVVKNYRVKLVSVYDAETGEDLTYRDLENRVENHFKKDKVRRVEQLRDTLQFIDARDVSSNLPDFEIYSGRQLNGADAAHPVIVLAANDVTLAAGLSVGDRLTFLLRSKDGNGQANTLTVEVVGMTDRRNSLVSGVSAPNYVPLDLFPPNEDTNQIRVIMDIGNDQLPALRQQLSDIKSIFVLEAKSLNDLLNRVIEQFTTFPTLVAALALFTGGIVIANSVALSAMERQRDIATMKALGLGRWRVLGMLLLEYGLMGLMSGIIGIGISAIMLGVVLALFFQGDPGHAVPYATVFLLMLLCVGISLLAAFVTAWGTSGEKPLNVLRYK